jgi:uncharacterized membrane protein YhaH (DUF805 family)
MKSIIELLTTFHGRIARRQWWIGFVITLVGSLVGTFLFNPELFTAEVAPPPSWPDTIWQLAWLVPGTAVTVKRFNDRDWPWWLGYALAALGAFVTVSPHLGFIVEPDAGAAGATVFWIFLAAMLAALVDNGFLRGTPGPNRYGPEPLAAAPPA